METENNDSENEYDVMEGKEVEKLEMDAFLYSVRYAHTGTQYQKKIPHLEYGTAGFRTSGADLDYVLFRMGILATIRSWYTRSAIGLMITASHNPAIDNGVKLIDPAGEMLEKSWEELATKIVNVEADDVAELLLEIFEEKNIDFSSPSCVLIGRDTRPSSELLNVAATDGILCMGGDYFDCGIVTTPMLHFFVVCKNTNGEYGTEFYEAYIFKLVNAFRRLSDKDRPSFREANKDKIVKLVIDPNFKRHVEAENVKLYLTMVGLDEEEEEGLKGEEKVEEGEEGEREEREEMLRKFQGETVMDIKRAVGENIPEDEDEIIEEPETDDEEDNAMYEILEDEDDPPETGYQEKIIVDGANGVGAAVFDRAGRQLSDYFSMTVYNEKVARARRLNYRCGADFVKVKQMPPYGVPKKKNTKCISMDGDADRIVYYYIDENGTFRLLDGDKIAILVASYFSEVINKVDLNVVIGVVQTAYANGNSTKYIKDNLNVEVTCVPTGVKYLHEKAKQFDIGIYFEANGHGTVVFSDRLKTMIKEQIESESITKERLDKLERLSLVMDMVNETVGDAFSDMLLVETILRLKGWNIKDWDAMYEDLPNRQLKVTIQDRTIIETTDAERKCTKPPVLQAAIDEEVKKYEKGRSFVRPSGTENVVRVYAEAATTLLADTLAYNVALLVYNKCGGVGDVPSNPINMEQ